MKKYSNEQKAYFTAKEKYEEIIKQCEIEKGLSGVNDMVTDGRRTPENKEIVLKRMELTNKIEHCLGKWEAFKKINEAEKAVIEWNFEQMKKADKYEEKKEDMERLLNNYEKYPALREKVLKASLQLKLS